MLNWLNGTELPLYFTITVANFRPPESGQFDRGPWAAPSHRTVTGVISVIIGTFHRTPDATPVKIQEILHYVYGPKIVEDIGGNAMVPSCTRGKSMWLPCLLEMIPPMHPQLS